MFGIRGHAVAAQPGAHLALGGGGLAHLIIRLFIWHELFRLVRYLWRVPTFGPFIVVVLGLVLIGLMVWRRGHGPIRWGGRRRGWSSGRRSWSSGRRSNSTGPGSGPGPRDW